MRDILQITPGHRGDVAGKEARSATGTAVLKLGVAAGYEHARRGGATDLRSGDRRSSAAASPRSCAVYLTGLRLREGWYAMPGAVGMWLWGQPLAGRGGSPLGRDRLSDCGLDLARGALLGDAPGVQLGEL